MEVHLACNLIARSIGSVMRQSLDDNFKEECKNLLGATNTNMVEETIYEKLMHIAQNGSSTSAKQQICPVNPSTSSATQDEPPQVAKAAEMKIHENIPICEMYRQTIQLQKRSLSSQPIDRTESRSKLQKCLQNSAPF